jgi:hypothetical protein
MPARDPDERRQIASIAALSRSATETGADRLAAANRAWRASFRQGHQCAHCKKAVIDQTLPEAEIGRRADALYRLHMKRLALARSQNRRRADERLNAAIEAEGLAAAADAELADVASA